MREWWIEKKNDGPNTNANEASWTNHTRHFLRRQSIHQKHLPYLVYLGTRNAVLLEHGDLEFKCCIGLGWTSHFIIAGLTWHKPCVAHCYQSLSDRINVSISIHDARKSWCQFLDDCDSTNKKGMACSSPSIPSDDLCLKNQSKTKHNRVPTMTMKNWKVTVPSS